MIRNAGLLALLSLSLSAPAVAQERGAPVPLLVEHGRELFARHCAVCHGMGGTGDGPAASALRTPPSDLTRIAARRDGEFPAAKIAGWIDGRFEVVAHGTREMPIWGVELREGTVEGLEEEIVRGQIDMLVEYLRTIQRSD